jgi:glutathione peroxidase-family protein
LQKEYQVSFGIEEKKKILGLNAARLYGIDIEAQKTRTRQAENTAVLSGKQVVTAVGTGA